MTTRHNGYAIRAIREARGMSNQDLCNKVGLSDSALRNIELEHKELRIERLQQIADGLEVPIQALARVPLTSWGSPRQREPEAVPA